jgi:hypothetical protein
MPKPTLPPATVTDELDELARRLKMMTDRIAETMAMGPRFSPVSYEMLALDCKDAANCADQIAEILKSVNADA